MIEVTKVQPKPASEFAKQIRACLLHLKLSLCKSMRPTGFYLEHLGELGLCSHLNTAIWLLLDLKYTRAGLCCVQPCRYQSMPRLREPGHRQRARIACRTCRQSKLRCGLVENPPCPRCSKLGLDCVVDPQYQRIQNRDKIEELEDQLGHLREQLVTHREPDRSSSATYGNPKRASDDTPCSQQNQAEAPIVLQHVSTPYPLARNGTSEPTLDTIGDVVLRPGQAEALFSL